MVDPELRAINRHMERWLGPVPWKVCSCGATIYIVGDSYEEHECDGETAS